nr:hypothetical protein SHINE37_90107 [Rhizobiaceae bacterium]
METMLPDSPETGLALGEQIFYTNSKAAPYRLEA